ncbi:MAG: DMT family transporter [Saccharofermentanales bacterium]
MDRQRIKAIIMLVFTALLWSTGGLLIKMVDWNPLAIAGSRSLIAAILMLSIIRRPKTRVNINLVMCSLMYACTVIFFVTANKLTTSANAILLQYTAPVFVAILGIWLLKEKTRRSDWLAILCVMGGMVLFFLDDLQAGSILGNVIAILSGVSFALFIIFLRRQKDEAPMESCLWGNILTAAIGIPFMIREGLPDRSGLIGILLLGVFQLGLSYILYSWAIRHVTALEAILIPVIEPIFNPVFVLIAFGEVPGRFAIIGGIIIIAAIVTRSVFALYGRNRAVHRNG